MRRFIDDLIELCEKKLKDPRVTSAIYNGVVVPLKEEIEDGKLDVPIAEAIVRIAQPAIWCIIILFVMLTSLLLISLILLSRVNSITKQTN